MFASTLRDRRWSPARRLVTRGVRSSSVGCAGRGLTLLAAVPGSWCVLVPAIEAPNVSPAGDLAFTIGAVGFVGLLAGGFALGHLARRLDVLEQREREASWDWLATRVAARRAVVEGATARLGGPDVLGRLDTPDTAGGR